MLGSSPLASARFLISPGAPVPWELADIFGAMQLHIQHPQLRNIQALSRDEPPEPRSAIDETVMQPLLVFFNLSILFLSFKGVPFRMNNRIVREMATAWPRLEKLVLGTEGWFLASEITPSGLMPLLRLPLLRVLSISINASTVDVAPEFAAMEPNAVNTELKDMMLQDSLINDVGPMAAFLSKFVPNLNSISSWDSESARNAGIPSESAQEFESRWNEVARLVVFAAVREE